jgi:hypothetical protein
MRNLPLKSKGCQLFMSLVDPISLISYIQYTSTKLCFPSAGLNCTTPQTCLTPPPITLFSSRAPPLRFLERRAPCCRNQAGSQEGIRSGIPWKWAQERSSANAKGRDSPLFRKLTKRLTVTKDKPKTSEWLEQAKNYHRPLPDAPIQREPGYREGAT